MEGWMIALLGLGFVGFFVLMFVLVARILSLFGWSKFARRFRWDRPEPAEAKRFGMQTLAFGSFPRAASYRNAITVWLDDAGIYLRPIVLFRMFHPMLHIPWSEIAGVEPRKLLAIKSYKVTVARDLPPITMGGGSGEAVLERWAGRQPSASSAARR